MTKQFKDIKIKIRKYNNIGLIPIFNQITENKSTLNINITQLFLNTNKKLLILKKNDENPKHQIKQHFKENMNFDLNKNNIHFYRHLGNTLYFIIKLNKDSNKIFKNNYKTKYFLDFYLTNNDKKNIYQTILDNNNLNKHLFQNINFNNPNLNIKLNDIYTVLSTY